MKNQNKPKFSIEQQLAIMYENLNEMDERIRDIESSDPCLHMRIPQYIDCETDADDPQKKAVIDFADSGDVLFIVNFVKGNNIPDDKNTVLELLYEDEEDPSGGTMKTFAFGEVSFLPKQLYPGAHVMIQSWIDDEADPDDIPDDGYEFRELECVAVTSPGIPPIPDTSAIEQKLDELLQRVEALEKALKLPPCEAQQEKNGL